MRDTVTGSCRREPCPQITAGSILVLIQKFVTGTRVVSGADDILAMHRHNDVTTASLIENRIDQTERRTSFLTEIVAEC